MQRGQPACALLRAAAQEVHCHICGEQQCRDSKQYQKHLAHIPNIISTCPSRKHNMQARSGPSQRFPQHRQLFFIFHLLFFASH
jgi:hypothetical protein